MQKCFYGIISPFDVSRLGTDAGCVDEAAYLEYMCSHMGGREYACNPECCAAINAHFQQFQAVDLYTNGKQLDMGKKVNLKPLLPTAGGIYLFQACPPGADTATDSNWASMYLGAAWSEGKSATSRINSTDLTVCRRYLASITPAQCHDAALRCVAASILAA